MPPERQTTGLATEANLRGGERPAPGARTYLLNISQSSHEIPQRPSGLPFWGNGFYQVAGMGSDV